MMWMLGESWIWLVFVEVLLYFIGWILVMFFGGFVGGVLVEFGLVFFGLLLVMIVSWGSMISEV